MTLFLILLHTTLPYTKFYILHETPTTNLHRLNLYVGLTSSSIWRSKYSGIMGRKWMVMRCAAPACSVPSVGATWSRPCSGW